MKKEYICTEARFSQRPDLHGAPKGEEVRGVEGAVPAVALKQEALRAWNDYQASGLHLSNEEADAWMAKLEAGEDLEPPPCRKQCE